MRVVLLVALAACRAAEEAPDAPVPPSWRPPTTDPPTTPEPRPVVTLGDVPGGAASDQNAVLFGDDDLPVFSIEVSEAGMDALRVAPYEWVEGALIWQGVRYEPVGVRVKGENSFQPIDAKPSLKIDFDRFAPLSLLGLEGLTLNNMDDDPSKLHERVAYRLYREFGVPAARATHAWVLLNGLDYGLYTHVEDVDQNLAEHWFADPGGMMVEVHDVDFEPPFTPDDFSHEFGPWDPTNLEGVFAAVSYLDPDVALLALEDHMSIDSWVDYWAVSAVVGQYDSYPYGNPGDDTHLYDDPTTGVLHWLPHGVDETFSDPSRDPRSGINGEVGRVCLAAPECADLFAARVLDAQATAELIDLAGYVDRIRAQIEPMVLADTREPHDDATIFASQQAVHDFVADRRAVLEALFP